MIHSACGGFAVRGAELGVGVEFCLTISNDFGWGPPWSKFPVVPCEEFPSVSINGRSVRDRVSTLSIWQANSISLDAS